jgi:hypothetical protein
MKMKKFLFSASLTATITTSSLAQQTTVFVNGNSSNTTAPSGSNPASTWTGSTGALKYLQDGLTRADQILAGVSPPAFVQVWVRGNTTDPYRPDLGTGFTSGVQSETFTLRENVEVYGGFAGTEANTSAGFALRNIIANVTILSGDLGSSNYSYHVVSGEEVDDTARLDGFRITGGRALGEGDAAHGGGVWLKNTSASIIRCTIVGNQATDGGGAYIEGQLEQPVPPLPNDPNFTSSSFLGNNATDEGGGAYNTNGHATFVNTVFSGNTADICGASFAAIGDGIRTHALYINCTFTGNVGDSSIGAIQPGSFCEVDNCVLWGDSPDEFGGTGTPTVNYSDVQGGATGTGNINSDPLFADADGADDTIGTLDDSPRLRCGSPALEAANDTYLPADDFDLDLNPATTVLPFDRDDKAREVNDLDIGAFEHVLGACEADITGDGVVGTADLLAVIAAWGPCTGCPEDIAVGSCGGDGTVGTADLLSVIANWGLECSGESESFAGGGEWTPDPEAQYTVLDCMAAAEENALEGAEYIAFVFDCLCEAGVIECDD